MVLHDNKWDKRAKTKYLKKHNLLPVKVEEGPQPKWSGKHDQEEGSDEEHESGAEPSPDQPTTEEESQLEGAEGLKRDDSLVEFELEPEQNPEDADIIAQHIAEFKFEAPKPKHIQYTGDQQEFNDIGNSIAHEKLTRNIKKRFGKASYSLPDEDDDDNFWESTAAAHKQQPQEPKGNSKVQVDETQQDFLDSLLR